MSRAITAHTEGFIGEEYMDKTKGIVKYMIAVALAFTIGLGGWVISSDAVQKKIIGIKSECDTTLTGCQPPPPLALSILCTAGAGVCVRNSAPDWTNSSRFYGTGGTNCRVSVDEGSTWRRGSVCKGVLAMGYKI